MQCVAGWDLLLRANATQPRRFGGKYPSYVRSAAAAAEYKRLPSSKSNLLLALSQICNNNLIPGVRNRYPDIYVQIWTLLTIDGFYIFSRVVSTSSWMVFGGAQQWRDLQMECVSCERAAHENRARHFHNSLRVVKLET